MGVIDDAVVDKFVEAKHLRFAPETMPQRENGAHRYITAKVIKAKEVTRPPESLSDDEVTALLVATANVRDFLLIQLMVETGLRVGETLGVTPGRPAFPSGLEGLGCALPGAHLHVRRRANENHALAKSHYPRSVPVGPQTTTAYRDYQYERDRLVPDSGCDFVFINLYSTSAPDTAMRYQNTRNCLTRVARRAGGGGAAAHVAAHGGYVMGRAGTPIDVVQKLMGHQSPVSTAKYLHPSDEQMRAAVDAVAHRRNAHAKTIR